ncbi:uncharacterized protein LOC119377585 [Rhipicephalus sanguineus]|uniref:uncharacterized protein LOC119377585 n=1 Tax=Rhipicephalus sanguineus TaxID=34632 RepID=UPI0018955770|nr:uncharacterized protein LOC119377585 [Rhipicephalus sanguineus]
MCSRVGAVSAARVGRGIRCTEKPGEDFQVVLPHLPSGDSVLHTVFLHGNLKARPYRVEHVRGSLARLSLLPEVVALGAYQMNHLWAVTFKDDEGKKKMLAAESFDVKDHRCMVIDPCDRGVRLKLYWLLHGVPDEDVRVALTPFGKVTEISRDKWKVQGCSDKGSTTRSVTMKLHVGVTVDDLPHQLRVAEDMALVVIPGRAPLCLRCRGIGHIRRDCRVPRCGVCRRYGHDDSHCVRSYASVTGPSRTDEVSEHLMDAADAEEASREDDNVEMPVKPLEPSSGAAQERTSESDKPLVAPGTKAEKKAGDDDAKAASESSSAAREVGPGATDIDMTAAGAIASKRAREASDSTGNVGSSGTGEPPKKTATGRRPTLKPRPNLPPDRGETPTPPPP